MPCEHGIGAAGLLREELVEVEHHAFAAQLLGNRQPDTFEDVVLPVGVVAPRQHHVEDRVVARIGPVLPRHHVGEVLAGHVDLAPHERVVDDLDGVDLVGAQHAREMDVSVPLEADLFVITDHIPVADTLTHRFELYDADRRTNALSITADSG